MVASVNKLEQMQTIMSIGDGQITKKKYKIKKNYERMNTTDTNHMGPNEEIIT